MNIFGYLLLLAFVWIATLELRHNGIKGMVADSKALAAKAAADAKRAMASVGVKRK